MDCQLEQRGERWVCVRCDWTYHKQVRHACPIPERPPTEAEIATRLAICRESCPEVRLHVFQNYCQRDLKPSCGCKTRTATEAVVLLDKRVRGLAGPCPRWDR